MNLHPTYDNIILQRKEGKKLSELIVTNIEETKPDRGTVLAVGPGALLPDGTIRPLGIEVGNDVVFKAYSGVEIKDEDDNDIIILKEEDIIAIEG